MKITNEDLPPPPGDLLDALHDPVGPTSGRRLRSKKIEEIKKAKASPAKRLFEEDEEKMRKKFAELIKKYHKIEVTAQLSAINISYSLDNMVNWFDDLFDCPADVSLNDFIIESYERFSLCYDFKVSDPNATAAQKKMIKEYMEESPPCFDFVKFFAKDTWRNIQKDFKEFSKEFDAFSKKHAASIRNC